VANAGHFLPEDQPGSAAEALAPFFSED
jgi:hypothetical protein